MKLSNKLKISFAILILVPVVLFSISIISIISIKLNIIGNSADTSASMDILANPVELVMTVNKGVYTEILDSANNNPANLENKEYLDGINAKLRENSSFIIIIEDGKLCYSGDESTNEILEKISQIDYELDVNSGIYLGDNLQVVISAVEYKTSGGKDSLAMIVMEMRKLTPQIKKLFIEGMIAVIIILVLTSALFTTWIYNETVNPINKLKLATRNIKNGNLDFDIDVKGKDEISELCRDFDGMRQQLLENAQEKIKTDEESRELIRNISHDLKTPITSIKGYAQGIMDGVVDSPEKLDKYIKTIYTKACDMEKLIEELTFYSQINNNKIPYNFMKVNVMDYFDCAVEEMSTDIESWGVKLMQDFNVKPDTKMLVDIEQFKRVLINVITNSVKYMDKEEKTIKIILNEDEQNIYIDIEDNGEGIDEKDIGHIFDRFFRSDESRNSARGGSGIGLSIVKKIIDDHGGTIEATSVKGEGTTMHITMVKFAEKKVRPREITR